MKKLEKEANTKKALCVGFDAAQQIQSFIANVVKAQLGEGSRKTNLYRKAYMKGMDLLCMSLGYQSPKFNQFDRKDT